MNGVYSLDLSGLPTAEISNKAPLWWGQVVLCAIEGSMLCMLIVMYFYLRLSVDVWPPPGNQAMNVFVPTIALIPLLLSAAGSYWASEGAKKNDRVAMIAGLGLNVALAVIFLILRWIEWRSFTFTWQSDVHGSIVWTILFLHTFDVVADVLFTIVLMVILGLDRNRVGTHQRIGVHVDSVVWYFLVGIWIPLYLTIYWGQYLVGTKI